MATVTVSQKGQLVIPKKLREKYGIKDQTLLELIDTGNGVLLIPAAGDPIRSSRGMLKGTKVTTQALLESRKADRKIEEHKFFRAKR